MLIQSDGLHRLVRDIFREFACSEAESDRVAACLVGANLTGHDSHGVQRTGLYVGLLRDGKLVRDRQLEIVTDSDAFAVVDGGFGFGQTIAPQAVKLGIAKANKAGAAIVALRNSGHIGRVGEWAEMASDAGLCSVHFVNVAGAQLVAPFGGVERRFSTAPFAAGFPVAEGPAVILDFATSLVAEGKVFAAASGGKPIPSDALVTLDGTLSGDPDMLYGTVHPRSARNGTGALRAFGEHKGSGLALICELLAGVLTGSGTSGPDNRTLANGMLSIYISPTHFGSVEVFQAETRKFINYVRDCRPADPGDRLLLPGDPERRTMAARQRDGLYLPDATWQSLADIARDCGLSADTYR